MAKTNQNFQIYKGEAKTLIIPILKDDGTALDLTSPAAFTLVYRVSKTVKGTTFIIEKLKDLTHTDLTVTGTSHNEVNIPFEHDDTDEQKSGEYYHELRVLDPTTGTELVVTTGTFTLSDSTTNVVTL